MTVFTVRGVAAMMLSVALVLALAGCKEKVDSAKEFVMEKINSEPVKKLEPEVMSLVDTEFAGMDINVTADDAKQVPLEEAFDDTAFKNAVYLDYPVFKAKTDSGGFTEITGPTAYIDPSKKTVTFENGAAVTGPRRNYLEADTLVWYYTRELLEVDSRFTLTNGRGTVSGSSFRTDISFSTLKVE